MMGGGEHPLPASSGQSSSSSWSGSWIQEWFSQGASSSAPNEGAQEPNTGTSALAAANPQPTPPQPQQPPVHQPAIQEHPGNPPTNQDFAELLANHQRVAAVIQEIHRDLHTRVPGGFQAERLADLLEERHGGARMHEILQSLQTERRHSPYFREVQTDFRTLRDYGGTEMQLRKEWQGRA